MSNTSTTTNTLRAVRGRPLRGGFCATGDVTASDAQAQFLETFARSLGWRTEWVLFCGDCGRDSTEVEVEEDGGICNECAHERAAEAAAEDYWESRR